MAETYLGYFNPLCKAGNEVPSKKKMTLTCLALTPAFILTSSSLAWTIINPKGKYFTTGMTHGTF